MAERVGFEPTWGDKTPNRFRVGAVMTTSVPLQNSYTNAMNRVKADFNSSLVRQYTKTSGAMAANDYPRTCDTGARHLSTGPS